MNVFTSGRQCSPLTALLIFLSLLSSESLKDLVAMEVDNVTDVPTPPASDVGSPTSFSQCGSDSEPDSPMAEDTKVNLFNIQAKKKKNLISKIKAKFPLLL